VRAFDREAAGDHLDRLYRAAWAMCGHREDAEDLVQETYSRVLARPRMLRGDDDLRYLMRALRNTHRSRLRTAARRPAESAAEWTEPADPRPLAQPEHALEVSALFAAIAELPADFRDAVAAVDVAGLSYAEAARALRVREATLTTRVHRGRQRLAGALAAGGEPAVGTAR
jgi:RNA polymerase sigma-70 factor (ECF subfamily)